jgi:hypothetical protein
MNKKLFFSALAFVIAITLCQTPYYHATSNSTGAPSGRTGGPVGSGATCVSGGCHTGTPTAAPASAITILNGTTPVTSYVPNTLYTVVVTATSNFVTPSNLFGFQVSCEKDATTHLGTFATTDARTQLVGSNKYVTQTAGGGNGTNESNAWTFSWTAPSAGSGTATFYCMINKANNNFSALGDSIVSKVLALPEQGAGGIGSIDNQLNLNTYPNPTTNAINFNFQLNSPSVTNLQVFDQSGKIVVQNNLGALAGKQNHQFDCSNFSAGVYTILLNAGSKSYTGKFVKQ